MPLCEGGCAVALIHGGDTESFRLSYGYEPLDFSSNINPLGAPAGVIQAVCEAAKKLDAYPDPLCRRLVKAIAEHEELPAGWVLCANGAADLIWRIAAAVRPRCAVVTAPAFQEYEAALSAFGCGVRRHPLLREDGFKLTESFLDSLAPDVQLAFLCNPNNPTGVTIAPQLLHGILEACRARNILVVVDECFGGFLDRPQEHALKRCLGEYTNLILLEAFTKLYGMAGARLGYCLCADAALLKRIQGAGQPWAVSSLAQAAGIAALEAKSHVDETGRLIRAQREHLRQELMSLGMTYVSGEANYLFFHTDIQGFPNKMRSRGVLIRDCAGYPGLQAGDCRIAVRTHTENIQLMQAMGACVKEASWQNR